LLQGITHYLSHAIIRADLTEQPVVRNLTFGYRVASRLKLLHNLGLGVLQQVRICLQDLDDLIRGQFLVRRLLWLLLRLRDGSQHETHEGERESKLP
jgi:hypothetical protein